MHLRICSWRRWHTPGYLARAEILFFQPVQRGVPSCGPDADQRGVTVLTMMLSSLFIYLFYGVFLYIYSMVYFSSTVKWLHLFILSYRSVISILFACQRVSIRKCMLSLLWNCRCVCVSVKVIWMPNVDLPENNNFRRERLSGRTVSE